MTANGQYRLEIVNTTHAAVLLLSLLSVFTTWAGVMLAFWLRENARAIAAGIGFSTGIMLLISLVELVPESIDIMGTPSTLMSFTLGAGLVWTANLIVPHTHSGLTGWLLAVLAGVISTGPVYTWYALLAELRGKGMRIALVAVVLYARAIKLPLLAHYFGLRYMLVLSLLIAGFSIVNGLLKERLLRQPDIK
jgi:zinc transporter ZupT